ncbi:S-adenosyl-L-methionine-dependent methyltransferase [Geopyxis carbonaria]|nr:S-adenosyl-L-methionine-dependent methyltransferase [Geopyxis carbonaria]
MAASSTLQPDILVAADDALDSDLGESLASDTTSLESQVRDYVYENGRRFHGYKAGKYVLPNDETEQDRLDLLHHIYLMVLGGDLHLPKINPNPQAILDVGTGTGIWAIDMADKYPGATVIGCDLSPIQPGWVPTNCKFEVDDIEDNWTWDRKFDFVHSRGMAQAVHDWKRYLGQMYDHLLPGGKFQLTESEGIIHSDDNTITPGCPLEFYFQRFQAALVLAGIPDPCSSLEQYAKDAGFVNVVCVKKKLPWGGWPKDPRQKELGRWALAILETGFKAYGLALFTRYLKMDERDAQALCDGAFKNMHDRKVHAYNFHWYVYGEKPMEGEKA